MENLTAEKIAARNKDNYLKAKAAFNVSDIVGCMQFYSPDHQIMFEKERARSTRN